MAKSRACTWAGTLKVVEDAPATAPEATAPEAVLQKRVKSQHMVSVALSSGISEHKSVSFHSNTTRVWDHVPFIAGLS